MGSRLGLLPRCIVNSRVAEPPRDLTPLLCIAGKRMTTMCDGAVECCRKAYSRTVVFCCKPRSTALINSAVGGAMCNAVSRCITCVARSADDATDLTIGAVQTIARKKPSSSGQAVKGIIGIMGYKLRICTPHSYPSRSGSSTSRTTNARSSACARMISSPRNPLAAICIVQVVYCSGTVWKAVTIWADVAGSSSMITTFGTMILVNR